MTTQQTIKLYSAIAAGLDAVLAYADTIKTLPIPGWLVHSWGFIFLLIVAVDRGLHAYLGDPVPVQAVLPDPQALPLASNPVPAHVYENPPPPTDPPDWAKKQLEPFRQPLGQPQKPV